ncbi:hypothetical protein [Salmonella phage vB_SalM_SPJ41]|uniref:Uncharacterized protein n=1 Tax=Salmonella phage vB_SalM_SPJ41 TaxID=2961840 RepID=A0A9E7P5X1_9CAUD|nr:hypothetical protein [Salmonella phage vB_SalM_SPJ41]
MCSSQLEIADIIDLYQTAKSHGYITSIGKNSHYDVTEDKRIIYV